MHANQKIEKDTFTLSVIAVACTAITTTITG